MYIIGVQNKQRFVVNILALSTGSHECQVQPVMQQANSFAKGSA